MMDQYGADATRGLPQAQQQGLPIAVPVQATGNARVDAALERLQELDQAPIDEHAEVFADIHARLSSALGDSGTPESAAGDDS